MRLNVMRNGAGTPMIKRLLKLNNAINVNNDGSTMTEVLVAFTMLMVLFAALTGIIKLSSNMLFQSRDLLSAQTQLESELYKKNYGNLMSTDVLTKGNLSLQETDRDGNLKGNELKMEHAKLQSLEQPADEANPMNIVLYVVEWED